MPEFDGQQIIDDDGNLLVWKEPIPMESTLDNKIHYYNQQIKQEKFQYSRF